MTKRQTKSAKKLINIDVLCYSVNEADHASACELTRLLSVGADRGNIARKQSFKIGWMHISSEELAANMYSGRKVGLVGVFSVFLLNHHGSGNEFREVVHDKSGEDFLEDVLHLF